MNNSSSWYRGWHQNPKHVVFHWAIFFIVVLVSLSYLLNQIGLTYGEGGTLAVNKEATLGGASATISDITAIPEGAELDIEGILEHSFSEEAYPQTHEFKNYQQLYYAVVNGKRIKLNFAGDGPTDLATGTKIRVHGRRVKTNTAANELVAPDASGTVDAGTLTVLEAAPLTPLTPRKAAIILFKFQDAPTASLPTQDFMRSTVFGQSNSINAYYYEQSFGKTGFIGKVRPDGDVYGPYVIASSGSSCSPSTWASQANSAAMADGFSSTGYQNIMYVEPGSVCSWAGLGGSVALFINGYFSFLFPIAAHEFGHTFGLPHASDVTCSAGMTSCVGQEYGDPYDTMGYAYSPCPGPSTCGHFNNFLKGKSLSVSGAWLDPVNKMTVTASGIYTLAPLEKSSTNIQTLIIARSPSLSVLHHAPPGSDSTRYLYNYQIEFRQPYGFDRGVGGLTGNGSVLIRLTDGSHSWLLEKNGVSVNPLKVGQTFVDPAGISITTLSISSTDATVQVTLSTPPPPAPIVNISANPTSVSSGGASTLSWSSANATSCTASDGWTGAKAISGSEIVHPTITTTYTLACTGAGGTATGSASVTVLTSCTHVNPTVSLSPSTSTAVAGTAVNYTLSVRNNDVSPCTSSTFNLTSSVPSGWTGTLTPTTLSLAPGATSTSVFKVTSSSSASGSNTVSATAKNASDVTKTATASAAYVVSTTANTAPAVNAGADQTIVLPTNSANLSATVTDDGKPNPPATTTVAWTKTSGTGTVTFSAPTSKITTATFSTTGTYVLRLTASDSVLTAFDELTVTVLLAGSGGSFSDNFDRADSTTLGNGWTQVSGAFTILSNHANHKSVAALAVQPSYTGGTQTVSVDMQRTQSTGASKLCLALRYQNATNFYAFCENQGGSSSPHIYKVVNNVWTQIDINSKSSGNLYVYRRLLATASGSTLTFKIDGVVWATATNTTFSSGSAGMYISASGGTIGENIENWNETITP